MDLRRLPFRRIVTLLLVFVIGAAILGGMLIITRDSTLGAEIRLPLLAIIGVIALLVALTLMAVIFGILGLSDRNEALGLPAGTVRAVMALSLIVIFVIAAIFLYSSLASPPGTYLDQLTQSQVDSIPGVQLLYKGLQSAPDEPDKRYYVWVNSPASLAAQDFAKQMLTLLGVLVTAITSFYFGTKATSEGANVAAKSPLPKLVNVSPSKLTAGTTGTITLQGSNLLSVNEVSLAQLGSAAVLNGSSVLSNDTTVTVTFDIPPNASGKFDVIVNTNYGDTARLDNALEIVPAAVQATG